MSLCKRGINLDRFAKSFYRTRKISTSRLESSNTEYRLDIAGFCLKDCIVVTEGVNDIASVLGALLLDEEARCGEGSLEARTG